MKKAIYTLLLLLLLAGGWVFANREMKSLAAKKPIPPPLTAAEKKTELEKWEATPEGIRYKNWESSPEGKKVLAGADKVWHRVNAFSNMEAVVTSLSLPAGARLGFGIMVRVDGEAYILSFGPEIVGKNALNTKNEFQPLHSLKVNDKIIIRSHSVSYAPKYAYPILAGDYVEKAGKILYKRVFHKGGC